VSNALFMFKMPEFFVKPPTSPSPRDDHQEHERTKDIVSLGVFRTSVADMLDVVRSSPDDVRQPAVPSANRQRTAVGPSSCLIQESDVTYEGRQFRRTRHGLQAAPLDGYLAKIGDYKEYFRE